MIRGIVCGVDSCSEHDVEAEEGSEVLVDDDDEILRIM
jgi:hypothetical protein